MDTSKREMIILIIEIKTEKRLNENKIDYYI